MLPRPLRFLWLTGLPRILGFRVLGLRGLGLGCCCDLNQACVETRLYALVFACLLLVGKSVLPGLSWEGASELRDVFSTVPWPFFSL